MSATFALVLLMSVNSVHVDRDSGGAAAVWLPYSDEEHCKAARDQMAENLKVRMAACLQLEGGTP